MCAQYGKWACGEWAGVKELIVKFSRNIACRKCEWSVVWAVVQEEFVG